MTIAQNKSISYMLYGILVTISLLLLVIIFILDIKTSEQYVIAPAYCVVIIYNWLLPGRYTNLVTALVCSTLCLWAANANNQFALTTTNLQGINTIVSLLVIWVCTALVSIARSSFISMSRVNDRLQQRSELLTQKILEIDRQRLQIENSSSEIQKMNKALKTKNEELESFTYITSHDLQEPLRTIVGLVSLLKKRYHTTFDEKGTAMIDYISAASLRLTMLIKSLLEYSRLGILPEFTLIDSKSTVEAVLDDLYDQIEKTKSEIYIEELHSFHGSPMHVHQLFQNLISNAIKFMKVGQKPIVSIRSKISGRFVEFCIEDNGIGVTLENKAKLFRIFQRLNDSKEYEGNGIGLAFCKRIVELHNGEIWIDSTPGIGSRFYFTVER